MYSAWAPLLKRDWSNYFCDRLWPIAAFEQVESTENSQSSEKRTVESMSIRKQSQKRYILANVIKKEGKRGHISINATSLDFTHLCLIIFYFNFEFEDFNNNIPVIRTSLQSKLKCLNISSLGTKYYSKQRCIIWNK